MTVPGALCTIYRPGLPGGSRYIVRRAARAGGFYSAAIAKQLERAIVVLAFGTMIIAADYCLNLARFRASVIMIQPNVTKHADFLLCFD